MNFRHDEPGAGAKTIELIEEKLPLQVLVVDDSRDIREFVALLLRLSGYRVIKAANGRAAQDILRTELPALVISDLEMPVCDGWEMLAHCHAKYPALPVLILSGAGLGRRPEVEGWAAGYLQKPLDLVRFHDEVERLTSRAA